MIVPLAAADPGRLLADLLAARERGDTPAVLGARWPSAVAETGEALLRGLRPPAEPSLVVFTSGSAGQPRAVVRTWASWWASHEPFSALTGIGPGSTVLVPGPLSATLHLYGAVHAVDVGAALRLGSIDDPGPWDAVHLVPGLLRDLLDSPQDLAGRTAICAGDALPRELADQATARGLRLVHYYGASELSFVAAEVDGAGLRPFPGAEVAVRDGLVWVRSPYLCSDVLGGPPLRRDARGFATVGDRGAWAADRTLRLHGRGAGTVVTGGVSVPTDQVAEVLRAVPGVEDVLVVGLPDPRLGQVVAAVVAGAEPPSTGALRAAAAAALAPAWRPRRWRRVPALPRTDSGKVSLAAAAALFEPPRRCP